LDISVKNVSYSYGKKVRALDGIDLDIRGGRIFGLIGTNGSGKTTLMKVMTGILKPQRGEVQFDSKKVEKNDLKKLVGYMPEDLAVYEDLTVIENIKFFLSIYGRPLQEALELLKLFDLTHRAYDLVGTLSEGYKRRVSLTCALANNPQIVMLDDPVATIDLVTRQTFWEYFNKAKELGKTIVLSTHIISEAKQCDEIAFIHKGKVVIAGPPEKIVEKYGARDLESAFTKILAEVREEESKTVAAPQIEKRAPRWHERLVPKFVPKFIPKYSR